ncbi:MAG: two-component regulator propeller domain-containing protein [Bacteroidales bacterium]|nr:two-component regulator propeller domain-containing protein [Bacteroidales bacterium]
MNKLNFISGFAIFLILSMFSFGQIAVGQWRDHLPYSFGTNVTVTDKDVYMVTNVGLLKYNKTSGETEKLTKINGLSDSGVKSIAWHESLKIVILGYSNGNIDLINGNQIINLADIKRKTMNGDKNIYSICLLGNTAYLGCGFGIVVLDLDRTEIKETWFIGNNGTNVKINSLDTDGSSIYAATDIGIFKGDLSLPLVDFSFWEIISAQNLPSSLSWMVDKSFNTIKCLNGKLIANYHDNNQTSADTLLVYDGNNWSVFNNEFNEISSICGNNEELILCSKYWIKILDSDLNEIRHIWQYDLPSGGQIPQPSYAVFDNNIVWIADTKCGLIKNTDGWHYQNITVNGPSNYTVFDMSVCESEIIAVAGGMNLSWGPQWKPAEVYKFNENIWNNYNYYSTTGLSQARDLVRVLFDPSDPSRYFLGSWIDGIVEFRNDQFYAQYNESNSTLSKVPGVNYIRIGGMAIDSEGNLWVTNSLTSPQIHVLSPEGEWTSIDYSSYLGGINIGHIIITKDDIKWVILPQGVGLFVFDDNGTPSDKTDDRTRKLTIIDEDGETISNDVFSIAEDKNGYIWVGTSKGVAVYYNPEDVFEPGTYTARQIKIPRNDGTDNADNLLGNEIVTSIKVDGANKKWFGTQTGGAYYTSADGLEEIYHFTKDNSPLFSDNIICSAIVPNTGEVFFGTSAGIISYRNTATEGSDDFIGVYAFPNPVKPDYRGPITITGLVAGSYVKITDISGNLLFETRSEGGQAIWYGEDMNGKRVCSGVYLVLSSNETGSKTDITKILFINGNE